MDCTVSKWIHKILTTYLFIDIMPQAEDVSERLTSQAELNQLCGMRNLIPLHLVAAIETYEYLMTRVPVSGENGKCQNLFYGFVFVYKLVIIIEWGANVGHY